MSDTAGEGCEPTTEIPYNGIDEDCDGADLTDADGDGWDAEAAGGEDCDDANAAVAPYATERCDTLVDEDCDGRTDEECDAAGAIAPDPGGYAWVCGPPGPPGGAALLGALLVVALRHRRR